MRTTSLFAARPRELVINVTLQCPLRCSHCCFSSDMFKLGHLDGDGAVQAVREAAALGSFEIVHFVGGDPFLHPDIMQRAFAEARAQGLAGGATTSAFWAKSLDRARTMLRPLVAAGLTELTLSHDDAHAAFVPVKWVHHAMRAGLELGLAIRIAVTVAPGAAVTAEIVRSQLRPDEAARVAVYAVPVNETGRAAETGTATEAADASDCVPDPQAADDAANAPCHSVLRTFTVTHDGDIQPCCGVLPQYPGLRVGGLATGLAAAVEAACADPLWQWLAYEGPAAVLREIGGDARGCTGVCAACDRIFRDPARVAAARAAAEGQRARLAAYGAALRLMAQVLETSGDAVPAAAASVDGVVHAA